MAQKYVKRYGRLDKRHGCHGPKLTEEQVKEILAQRDENAGILAKRYGVDRKHINNIWRRRFWKKIVET